MNTVPGEVSRPVPAEQQNFARALGWASLALAAAELLFPNRLGRLIGIKKDHGHLFRLLGLRELAAGLGILSQPKYPAWVWSRVAGDVMDLALLGASFISSRNSKSRLLLASAGVLGVTALDIVCGERLTLTRKGGGGSAARDGLLKVRHSTIINRSPQELYQFWRNFENLPQIMYHLEEVAVLDDRRSRWRAKGPGGKPIQWEAEITQDHPNELIAWRSLPGSEVFTSGVIKFEPATGGRGTVVRVEMDYHPIAGMLGVAIAKALRREPLQEVKDSLRYFKQLMETGVIPTTVGQPSGPKWFSRNFDLPMPEPNQSGKPSFQNA